jgi:hypothetical protein
MSELMEANFSGHPAISNVLHQHLVDHATPQSKHDALSITVTTLQARIEQVKKVADTAASSAKNKK